MNKRACLCLFGAVLVLGAASVVSAAPRPGTAQTSSTTSKKKKVSSKSKRKPKVKGQTVPTADRIKDIQAALQKDGSYQGEPTGKWDAATSDAMMKFQEKNGFSPTGKIDAPSLNKLGLGSETAGKGAPAPAATPAAPVTRPAVTSAPSGSAASGSPTASSAVAPADPTTK